MDNFDLKKYLAEGKLTKVNKDLTEEYNDMVEWDWEYISINRKGDVDVPCVITLEQGDEPYHVHLPASELSQYGIDVVGKEPVELTDGETEAILDMVEAKIQAEY